MSSQSSPYRRVLIKLSGQALAGNKSFGIDPLMLKHYAAEIAQVIELNVEIAIVIGGGNFLRGSELAQVGIDRITADHMGMLGTIMNCLAFRDALEQHHIATRIMSSIPISGICEHYNYRNAIQHLARGKVVLFAAGTGNPLVTTDTCASLRAIETKCDLLIKATGVNGIYDSDPHTNPAAQLLSTITFEEAIEKQYKIMDLSAFVQCQEHDLAINVCNISSSGTLKNLLIGYHVGTRVIKSK